MQTLRPILTIAAILALFTCPLLHGQPSAEAEYVVGVRNEFSIDGLDAIARQIAKTYGGAIIRTNPTTGKFVVRMGASRARMLTTDPRIASVTAAESPGSRPRNVTSDAETVGWGVGVAYEYDGSGNVKKIGNDTFVYDVASRLVKSTVNSTVRTYEYDGFGNRKTCLQGTADCQGHTITSTNNRINGADVAYDSAGNVTALNGHAYSYDALNMQTSDVAPSGVTREYVYTADDERIAVYTSSSWWRWTIRDVSGKVLREFMSEDGQNGKGTASWQWSKDYVWRDGLLLATRQKPPGSALPTTYHYHLDHLGTPRRITDDSDRIVGFHDYHPFGPEAAGGKLEPSLSLLKYTGHERDVIDSTSTELDYMHARYTDPTAGRFLSVDPIITKEALRSPQLWNRYAYVGNNPMKYLDPTGKLLQLSSCVENSSSPACNQQYSLLLATFGNRSASAGRYLQLGKNGMVTFKGISGAAFAARFGLMGQAANYLISNRAATFTLVTGRSDKTVEGRGAYFEATMMEDRAVGGGTIGVDVGAFPQAFFGVPNASATEALVHEMGHAVSSLFPGYASAVDGMAAASSLMRMGSSGSMEAYATAFENAWRREVLGSNVLRNGYFYAHDVRDISRTALFP